MLDRAWVWSRLGALAKGVGAQCDGAASTTALEGNELATVWSAEEVSEQASVAARADGDVTTRIASWRSS